MTQQSPIPDDQELLTVRNLEVHFRQRGLRRSERRPIKSVGGVDFEVFRGETLGIVGESGSGKTTTAKALLGLVPQARGDVELSGLDVLNASRHEVRRIRKRIQMVLQDPYTALDPTQTVGAAIAEPIKVHRLTSQGGARTRVLELLELVGLRPDVYEKHPSALSGGQRQRVNIARALACEPEIIIADEPTSSLDVSVRAQVVNLLLDLQARLSLTYVLISHDLGLVRQICDRVIVMYAGRIVEFGTREEVFENPLHPYTRALLSVVPVAEPEIARQRLGMTIQGEAPSPADLPTGCSFHPRCSFAMARCSVESPQLGSGEDRHTAACFLLSDHELKGTMSL